MKDLRKYIKPKFSIIKFSCELLQTGGGLISGSTDVSEEDPLVKAQTFRIFDDSFDDDLSIAEESDYATTTNTIEVW